MQNIWNALMRWLNAKPEPKPVWPDGVRYGPKGRYGNAPAGMYEVDRNGNFVRKLDDNLVPRELSLEEK